MAKVEYKEIHVVLSDDEEMALVQELGRDPLERVEYHTSRKVWKDIEQRIFRYFEQSLHADPEAFNRRYVFRSCYGKDA
jgi:septation ring formation regulator EzrA